MAEGSEEGVSGGKVTRRLGPAQGRAGLSPGERHPGSLKPVAAIPLLLLMKWALGLQGVGLLSPCGGLGNCRHSVL